MADLYLAVTRLILVLAFCFPAEPSPSTPAGAAAAAFMGAAVCLAVLTIFVRVADGGGARAVGVVPLAHGMMVTLKKLLVSAGMAAAAASVAIRICATTTY